MTKRDVCEIAVRLLGIMFLVIFLSSAPFAFMSFAYEGAGYFSNISLYRILSCLGPLPYLLAAVLLLAKGSRIARFVGRLTREDDSDVAGQAFPCTRLAFWITLIGLYFAVSSSSGLISRLTSIAITHRGSFWWSDLVSDVLTLAISLFLVFGSHRIEDLLRGVSKQNTGASPPAD